MHLICAVVSTKTVAEHAELQYRLAMVRTFIAILLASALLAASGCNRSASNASGRTVEAYLPDSGSVGFDFQPVKNEDGSIRLQASYGSQDKIAKFTIEFGPTRKIDSKDHNDFPMGVGKGKFVAEPGSDASVLLANLQKALEAKSLPGKVQRVPALPFEFVNIGDNLSQAADGGFNSTPPGGWTALKIFIGEGEQEGEVFVNFNLAMRKGQFSIKDPDYGDLVLKQLATVL